VAIYHIELIAINVHRVSNKIITIFQEQFLNNSIKNEFLVHRILKKLHITKSSADAEGPHDDSHSKRFAIGNDVGY